MIKTIFQPFLHIKICCDLCLAGWTDSCTEFFFILCWFLSLKSQMNHFHFIAAASLVTQSIKLHLNTTTMLHLFTNYSDFYAHGTCVVEDGTICNDYNFYQYLLGSMFSLVPCPKMSLYTPPEVTQHEAS